MFQLLTQLAKWSLIPLLIAVSMFSYLAAGYEPPLAALVTTLTFLLAVRAVRRRQYSWALGLLTVLVAFSPLLLESKLFLLIGLTYMMTATILFATFRLRPAATV